MDKRLRAAEPAPHFLATLRHADLVIDFITTAALALRRLGGNGASNLIEPLRRRLVVE